MDLEYRLLNKETAREVAGFLFSLDSARRWPYKGLREILIEIDIRGKKVRCTLLEQNPNTSSRFAARARGGEQIAWIVERDRRRVVHYYGRVDNGRLVLK